MASTNRQQYASVKETTVGTTPNTPRMRTRRVTSEGLSWVPTFVMSEELRSDGMNGLPIKTGEDSGGPMSFELSYPFPSSPQATDIESAFHAAWTDTNSRDNDGTADSVITAVTTAGTILTVTTGTAFVLGELYKWSGFGVTGNNGNFRCTTGSATAPVFASSGITDEAVPPAAARVKCIGFAGVASDITATASGLASTTLDFTTIPGIAAGKWLKIDSTTSGFGFATAALNTYIRCNAVSAHAITCDNLPSGWTTDNGSGKTIRVYFGDQIKNGTTQIGQSIERGFLGQVTPTYILQPGMVASSYSLDFTAKAKITGSVGFMGMTGASQSTTSADASPDAATALATYPVMACSSNVGRIGEAGSSLASPNFVKQLTVNIDNSLTAIESVSSVGAVGIGSHSRTVTGTMNTYFGDNSLLTKFFAGTTTSINVRAVKTNLAIVVSLPQVTYDKNGSPNAGGMNQDIMLPLGFTASKEETYTNAMILMDRFEYVDA
jgi:hypothetical protein